MVTSIAPSGDIDLIFSTTEICSSLVPEEREREREREGEREGEGGRERGREGEREREREREEGRLKTLM